MKRLTALLALGFAPAAQSAILLSDNFDGGGVNSVFAYSGTASTVNTGAGHGNVAQIISLTTSNNNSIAWNSVAVAPTPVLRLGFDFFMTDDATNNGSGGCCGEAADGLAIGFFPNAVYGATGASNPGLGPVAFNWEDGVVPGVPALLLAFDIFDSGGPQGNNASIAWNGAVLADAPVPGITLNNNAWHSAIMTITDAGANSTIGLTIDGTTIYSGLLATGVDLDSVGSNFRLIAGGRTGSAFANGQLDNVFVEAVPEPSVSALALGLLGGLVMRRRR
ncbi:MAG TPA: PEP-CTERM sorting domain-containing protein [Verrucomicrobiales bacterium]|jgi:hypothetical protein|nr:PEP-CTERM sorting domain-containing protein [Verrucomicrobiales bacterium]